MDNVKSKTHSEFADDNTVVTHGQNIDEVSEIAMEDSKEVITVWCPKWNMEISPEKTEVMVFPPPKQVGEKPKNHYYSFFQL